MEMQCAQRRVVARGVALWFHLRRHISAAHHRQGPQPRQCLVLHARQRVAAAQGELRALAGAGKLRRRRQADRQSERGEWRGEMSLSTPSPGLLQQRPFVLFWLARLSATMGYHMMALTIGWQIYALTNSAYDLGLVGLIQFIPSVVLTLAIGHAADRYDRRLIVRGEQSIYLVAVIMIMA